MLKGPDRNFRFEDGGVIRDLPGSEIRANPDWSEIVDFLDKGKSASYHVRSAFHKEVRRDDQVRAYAYAQWLSYVMGAQRLLDYVKGIVFEETRNVSLQLLALESNHTTSGDIAKKFVRSRKKHDLSYRRGAYDAHLLAWERAKTLPPLDINRIDQEIAKGDLIHRLAIKWQIQTIDPDPYPNAVRAPYEAALWDALDKHARVNKWAEAILGNKKKIHGYFGPKVLIEMMSGVWDKEEAHYLAPETATFEKSPILYELQDYVFDNHTRIGYKRVSSLLKNVSANKPQPPLLDMRWSGMERGVSWRDEFGKHVAAGGSRDAKWEDVPFDAKKWSLTREIDAYFYPFARHA